MEMIFCWILAMPAVTLMSCEGLLFAVVVGVIIGIGVGFIFLLMVCVCKHRSQHPPVIIVVARLRSA